MKEGGVGFGIQCLHACEQSQSCVLRVTACGVLLDSRRHSVRAGDGDMQQQGYGQLWG